MDHSEFHELAWSKLPVDIRKRAVERLRFAYDPSFFEDVRKLAAKDGLGEWLPTGWHFGQGMQVRNVLRSDAALGQTTPAWRDVFAWVASTWKRGSSPIPGPIQDSELPPIPEYYGKDMTEGNWDDYYIQCIEAAAGLREIE